jgi:hypothetical protein
MSRSASWFRPRTRSLFFGFVRPAELDARSNEAANRQIYDVYRPQPESASTFQLTASAGSAAW